MSSDIDLDGLDEFTFDIEDTNEPESESLDSNKTDPAISIPVGDDDANQPNEFYFDLETIPDYSRMDLFDEILGDLPPKYEACPLGECPSIDELVKKTEADIEQALTSVSPPEEYFIDLIAAEMAHKDRKGVKTLIGKFQKQLTEHETAYAERMKLLSTTPEYCSICCMAWAWWTGEPVSMIATNEEEERAILDVFWKFAETKKGIKFIGYNIIAFDLPVILTRSILLGVDPTRKIDLSVYASNRDCIDLYLRKCGPRGNLDKRRPSDAKSMAKLYGVKVPVEDFDGSMVAEAMQQKEYEKVQRYCESDVILERELGRKWRGVFA